MVLLGYHTLHLIRLDYIEWVLYIVLCVGPIINLQLIVSIFENSPEYFYNIVQFVLLLYSPSLGSMYTIPTISPSGEYLVD